MEIGGKLKALHNLPLSENVYKNTLKMTQKIDFRQFHLFFLKIWILGLVCFLLKTRVPKYIDYRKRSSLSRSLRYLMFLICVFITEN